MATDAHDSDSTDTRLAAREKCSLDLLHSEEEYVNMLEAVINVIYTPLRQNATRCGVKESRVDSVFVFLQHMLEFHQNFVGVLREPISILPAFAKYATFVQIYEDYIKKFSKVLDVVAMWRTMAFRDFIRTKLSQSGVAQCLTSKGEAATIDTLPWFLYRPIDRIKEYYRFLKDLKSLAVKGDADLKLLHNTLRTFRPIYMYIRKHEAKLQQKTQLVEMQLRIHGDFSCLVEKDRRFCFTRGCQMRRKVIGKKYKEITIYCFNDLFLWVSHRHKYKGAYSLLDPELEFGVPKATRRKDDDALMFIGKKTEKSKRVMVFASVSQRDKCLAAVEDLYGDCQQRIADAPAADREAIARRTARDTHIALELSESSRMSRSSLGEEPSLSMSASDCDTDIEIKPMKPRRETQHLTAEGFSTRRHVEDQVSDVPSDADEGKEESKASEMPHKSKKKRRKDKSKEKDKYIAQLEAELKEALAQMRVKDEEIRTLKKSAETTRDTLELNKAQIRQMEAELAAMKRRVQTHAPRSASYDFRRAKTSIDLQPRSSHPMIREDLSTDEDRKGTRPKRVFSG